MLLDFYNNLNSYEHFSLTLLKYKMVRKSIINGAMPYILSFLFPFLSLSLLSSLIFKKNHSFYVYRFLLVYMSVYHMCELQAVVSYHAGAGN